MTLIKYAPFAICLFLGGCSEKISPEPKPDTKKPASTIANTVDVGSKPLPAPAPPIEDDTPSEERKYYNSGELRFIFNKIKWYEHGTQKEFYKSGKLMGTWEAIEGRRHGPAITYYPDGTQKSIVQHENNREILKTKNGIFRSSISGKGGYPGCFYHVREFKDGVQCGVEYTYYLGKNCDVDLGKDFLLSEKIMPDGEMPGLIRTYFGYCSTTSQFIINGQRFGTEEEYYRGRLVRETRWEEDKKHGQEHTYHRNGKLKQKLYYTKGQKDGKEMFYDENGQLTKTIRWDVGKLLSEKIEPTADKLLSPDIDPEEWYKPREQKSYYPNGTLKQVTPIRGDMWHGTEKYYYPSGNLKIERNWVNDELHGKTIIYKGNGEVYRTLIFVRNRLKENISKETYEPIQNWQEVSAESLILEGEYIRRCLCNKPIETIPFKNRLRHGTEYSYYENEENGWYRNHTHQLFIATEYVNGLRHGKCTYYSKNGNVHSISKYVYGKKHGLSKIFHNNGSVKRQVKYVLDKKHGEEIEYDDEGKVIKTTRWNMGVEEPVAGESRSGE